MVWQPPEEQCLASFRGDNVSEKNINTQGKAELVAVQDVRETEAEKMKTGAGETGRVVGRRKST